MSRREIVVLVSRALALTQTVYALVEATLIPERVIWLMHRLQSHSVLVPGTLTGEPEFYSLLFTLLRFVIISSAAILFWICGPTMTNWLLPNLEPRMENES